MDRNWWIRLTVLLACVIYGSLSIYPTLRGLDLEKTSFPIKQKVNLGLDLQGGLYMVLGVDFNRVYRENLERQVTQIRDRLAEKEFPAKSIQFVTEGFPVDDPRIQFEVDPSKHDGVYQLLKDEYWNFRLTRDDGGNFEIGIAHDYRQQIREKTISQSIEVIRNRIDEFGVSEPSITSQGTDRVVVELPGVRDIERAKELIGKTAKLEFKIVHEETPQAEVETLLKAIETEHKIEYKEGTRLSEYVRRLNELGRAKLPAGTEISFERLLSPTGETIGRVPYLLNSRVEVTGDYLQDAYVQFDQDTQRPNVGFSFNPKGAQLFGKLTEENIGKRLAIVLDNNVHSAPVIQSKIESRGQITLGQGQGDKLMKEAKDLAIVLRAGALPAELNFLEQRVVGPSLGQDSIRLGTRAGLVGSFLVFLLIIFYYRVSGVIATVTLMLNVLFTFTILVGLEATLTLPGIAGIALTVGIAVDSNIVIFERIREEILAKKSLQGCIEAGFDKATRTIVDANVTNAAAALVLYQFGTGPIKGFAVTMLIGIVTSLFTAVFAARLFFDGYVRYLERKPGRALSI